ncbi:MAG: beta-ketoacyl-[acyl-carrier-protein] synthase II, partial [Planctomycetes bacterium]|nr:beta-ketoacyl-[acyl-carrier-protein] synthase II [Planctomycetota bacterium]
MSQAAVKTNNTRRVVITGLGVVSPLGCDVETFWRGIVGCESGAVEIDRFDHTDFKTHFACQVSGFTLPTDDPRKYRNLDLFTQYALVAAIEAYASSGLEIDRESPHRLGV